MKNILSSLNESEKRRILGMHYRASNRHYLSENPTGTTPTTTTQTTTPGDPSQSTVDLSSIMSELKTACNTYNTEIADKTKLNIGDKGLTTMVTPEGMIAGGPYIAITSKYMQDTYGTRNPYGYIGVELSKGQYLGSGGSTPRGITLPAVLLSMNSFIYGVIGDKEKGSKFITKHRDQLNATATTLFNTVDPIFKKLLAYKGYNSATIKPSGEVTISKTT